MTQKPGFRAAAIFAAATITFTGCIHHESTTQRDVERVRVEFENEAAGRMFYEALSKLPVSRSTESKTSVEIPVVFEHTERVVTGGNERFNRGVRECDTNQDGKVSETEARIFLGRYEKH
jgi:hypothetical protein